MDISRRTTPRVRQQAKHITVSLVVLTVLVTMAGCSDRDRRDSSDRHTPVAQPSAATLETCHAMYPTQSDLEQACIRRWTVGEAMPEPSAPPPQDEGTVIVQWCAGLAGIPPVHQETHRVTPAELLRLTECVDRRLRR